MTGEALGTPLSLKLDILVLAVLAVCRERMDLHAHRELYIHICTYIYIYISRHIYRGSKLVLAMEESDF